MRHPILLALAFLAAGCSHEATTKTPEGERTPSADSDTGNRPPSDSSAQTILAGLIKTDSDDCIKLVRFTKTDGQSKTVDGIDVYTFDFQAVVEAQAECWWKLGQIQTLRIYHQRDGAWWCQGTNLTQARSSYDPAGDPELNHLRKGETFSIDGSLTLERKESDWHARAQVCEPPVTFGRRS